MIGLLGKINVVQSLASPERACNDALPWFEGLKITSARREWPPPAIRCTYVDTDPSQTSQVGSVSGLSSKHLVVVAFLDLAGAIGITVAVCLALRSRVHAARSVEPACFTGKGCRSACWTASGGPGILRWVPTLLTVDEFRARALGYWPLAPAASTDHRKFADLNDVACLRSRLPGGPIAFAWS